MSQPASPLPSSLPGDAPRLTLRRALLQIVGFILGVALLVWCVRGAVVGADWEQVRHADPTLVVLLLAATAVSLLVNSAIFWTVLRPVRRYPLGRLVLLNLVAGFLNYAPVRLGLIARITYHMRADRMGAGLLGTWLLVIGGHMLLTLLVVGIAVLAAPLGAITVLLVVGLLVLAKVVLNLSFALPPAKALGARLDGLEPMLLGPRPYWSTEALRLLDIGAFVARMWLSARILGLELPPSDVIVLAVTAQLVSLSPFGRLGFREAAVALIAARLESGLGASGIDATFKQLAIVESLGEALVLIPAGGIALFWYGWAMRRAGPREATPTPPEPAAP